MSIAGFPCEYNSVDKTEMRGVWEALRLSCAHFSHIPIWLEGEALKVIQDLQVRSNIHEPLVLLDDARWLLSQLKVFNITDMHHEANRYADWLTKCIQDVGSLCC